MLWKGNTQNNWHNHGKIINQEGTTHFGKEWNKKIWGNVDKGITDM